MMNIFENNYPKDFKKDGFVDNPLDREKRNSSSLKPEDLLPESPEMKRNLQHQSVMVGLKCHLLGYGNIQEVAVP
ncbi:hypothetical protein O3M35_006762 [Rhynocoris fuscipes]|uniref:Uncharacterized protein n=1 Tax=Rhynocoris fuscipes TaxID=488301 RepID=A0AAW1DJX0_9HEMI